MAAEKKKVTDGVKVAFGDVLRQVREERDLSQQDLAFASDLDRTYISLLERGLRQPSLATVFLLATPLGTDVTDLVKKTAMHPAYTKIKR